MWDDLKGRTQHDLAPRVLESSFMAKAVWCRYAERPSPLGSRKSVPRVTWLYSVFLCGMSEWALTRVWACMCDCVCVRMWEGAGGISKRVPTVSLTVWFEWRQTLKRTLRKVLYFCEIQVLSLPLNAVKHRGRSCTKPHVLNKLYLLYQDWQSRGTLN